MARKGQAVFQLEINSDEEWKLLISKPGLIVSDAFSEWCGPCTSMMSIIKKTKVEINNDYLIFAMCNTDKISELKRFRNTSEPTWIFVASYQLLRVMYGCDAPELMRVIMSEFQHELLCIEGQAKRVERPISHLAPQEELKLEQKIKKMKEEEIAKKKEIEIQWDKVRHRYFERVARYLTNITVIVFFPHTVETLPDGKIVCPPSNRLTGQYDVARMGVKDQIQIQLTKASIRKMFYNCGILFPKILIRNIERRPVIATLLQEFQQFDPSLMMREEAIEHLDDVERSMAALAYGESMNPLDPSPNTVSAEFMFYSPQGTAVPPLWTPREHVSKAAAVEVLFPALIEVLDVKMDPIPPPSYVVIFEAKRAREVLDTAAQFSRNVMHVGFFDSADPEEAQLVCHTVHQYERLPRALKTGLKMVLAVEKTSSDPMLILAQMRPVHMSPDTTVGLKEVETFFPPMIDPVLEPDPWEPSPEDSFIDKEEEEEEEDHGEEEIEEEMEEEEVRESQAVYDDIPHPSPAKMDEELEEEEEEGDDDE